MVLFTQLFVLFLGVFAAGWIIGHLAGFQEGYWTDHP